MSGRTIARTAASVALIVLSTSSTASDCENRNGQETTTERSSRGSSQVVIRADADACWKITVDDRTRTGCGDATFYRHRSSSQTEVEKVDGKTEVTVTVVVAGKTVYSERMKANGQRVKVKVSSGSKDKDSHKDGSGSGKTSNAKE